MEPNERTTEQLVFIGLFNTLSESGPSEPLFTKNSDAVDVYAWCMNNEDEPANSVLGSVFASLVLELGGRVFNERQVW